MDLSSLPASPSPGLVNLLVEIPAGSRNKYQYDPHAGVMVLERVLHSSLRYPFDYGFVPNTLAADGAPLDAMVIMDEPTFAGCLIQARPIGVLHLIDGDCPDGKLLCVAAADGRKNTVRHLRQIDPGQLADVAEFFRTARTIGGAGVSVLGWGGPEAVAPLLRQCIEAAPPPPLAPSI
jgi:inorganic pyrophosphatase